MYIGCVCTCVYIGCVCVHRLCVCMCVYRMCVCWGCGVTSLECHQQFLRFLWGCEQAASLGTSALNPPFSTCLLKDHLPADSVVQSLLRLITPCVLDLPCLEWNPLPSITGATGTTGVPTGSVQLRPLSSLSACVPRSLGHVLP